MRLGTLLLNVRIAMHPRADFVSVHKKRTLSIQTTFEENVLFYCFKFLNDIRNPLRYLLI